MYPSYYYSYDIQILAGNLNSKCKMQNANANANGKCNRLSVKPFIATALSYILSKQPKIEAVCSHYLKDVPGGATPRCSTLPDVPQLVVRTVSCSRKT